MPNYTNSPIGPQYIVRTSLRQHRPYVASSFSSQLTPKERLARQQQKFANGLGTFGGFGVGSGFGGSSIGMGGAGSTILSSQGNFFSPQLSTDFLELPQSIRERREIYRHFYNSDELVGQALDIHTELPLSKVRLAAPKPRLAPKGFKSPEDYGKYILSRFQRMCDKVKLFQRLITMVHHYWLDGLACIFAEDSVVEVPPEVGHTRKRVKQAVLKEDGEPVEEDVDVWTEDETTEEREFAYYRKHYRGWEKLIVLPIDRVKITTFDYTDKSIVELIPSNRDRVLIDKARTGDPVAQKLVQEIPDEVRDHIEKGQAIPLGTDPEEGSFVYILTGSKDADSSLGHSILDRCHIAGTLVTARRAGQILQIPIEDLNPDTDEVLSGEGVWRDFEIGLRQVSEEISLLHVAKLEPPIGCTKDHKYPVLRGDMVVEAVAKDIRPGDYLQIAQIPLTESVQRIDLAAVLNGISEDYKARKSGQEVVQSLTIVSQDDQTFTVQYSKLETNIKKQLHLDGLGQATEWLQGITEPTTIRALVFCKKFGFNHGNLDRTLEKLRSLGAKFEVLGRTNAKSSAFDLRFDPSVLIDAPIESVHTKSFTRWLDLDEDLGYFLGYWLGDGHISRQPGLDYGSLGFTYGPSEPASVVSIEQQIKPELNRLGVAWSESSMSPGIHMDGYQDALIRWIAKNFGHVCEDKHLPDWIFDAPKEFLSALLRGFVDSDGDVVQKKDKSVSVRMSNSNGILMGQLFLLCTSLGIPASKTKPTKERWVKQATGSMSWAKPLYAIHFTHGPSVKRFFESGFLAKKKLPDIWKDGRSGSRHVECEGKLYYRVAKNCSATHTGPVYSLNVHEDHTFYVCGIITKNCLRTLYYREKLRQAQTSIASRAMTPKRIVWAEGLSDVDVDMLREQVDLSLVDPDYSIVTNYEVHWEEMGSRDRLLDLSTEYEQTERRLLAGLGVTESLMSGESLYSGDRLKLEVINQRYLHLREILQEYVEESLFRPVAQRMGFIEEDEWGQEVVLFPRLSFTRMPLRDSQDTFDALMNLYQKGSISIDLILELLNIDPDDTRMKIERDLFTVNDALFNEILRSLYNEVGRMLAEKSDVLDRVAKYMQLKMKPEAPEEGASRF